MTDDPPEFTIVRTVKAARDVVWRLWTEPAEMAHWLHPDAMHTPAGSVHVDLRVGGHYRYTMVDDETGAEHPTGGKYLEIVEPERLVFTWTVPGDPPDSSVVTVTLDDLGDRTEITLHVRGAAGHPGDGHVYDGWRQALDGLAAT